MEMQIINTTNESVCVRTKDGKFFEVPPEDSLGVSGRSCWTEWGIGTEYRLYGKVPSRRLNRVIIVDSHVLQFIDMREDFIVITKSDGYYSGRCTVKDATLPKIPGVRRKACVRDVHFEVRL